MIRIALILAVSSMPAFCGSAAMADLYTGTALSIEWLVDSSDEIAHIRVDAADQGDRMPPGISTVATLKGRLSVVELSEATRADDDRLYRIVNDSDGNPRLQFRYAIPGPAWMSSGSKPGLPSEWLLFLRTDGTRWRLVYAINLAQPKRQSRTAAITADGTVLDSKTEILRQVDRRIELSRSTPNGSRREIVDHWCSGQHGAMEWYEKTRQQGYYLSNHHLSPVRGGFVLGVSIEYWDSPDPGDIDEDLLITGIVVPADEQFRERLLQSVASQPHPPECTLLAVVNYPDRNTEGVLESIVESGSSTSLMATRLLYYFRYRMNPANPLDEKLIGKWRIEGRNETVHLDFRSDHTCTVNVRPTKITKGNDFYRPVDGKGYWAIRGGRLWIGRSHIIRDQQWSQARREFFAPKKMLSISRDSVRLEGGPPMKRGW